ncbi:holo-acyl-carrier-protein synthase [Candidatus Desulforudis audaxviator MP104C]|uniref:Holo-[acyl-carrier-protein] synthase n=1 Tax=Desulforudis audaxviator (strain MP104C) TaxID=477974 RepID=ACPS_DESAP|nr:RecName: Full=Holo-[acyl-carrier-protein] synthase; Short=Holo-ACP synthase; AltName: Full=4'-phosphopantetheinyl transferase AcpS [Candidatus Desulforudis audaxviator MP104C]ACA59016.1 holo-acyl-carrier-protein synthase [Candidatus Desulforudis audaxviator MP104C]
MILGIGVDLVSVKRIRSASERTGGRLLVRLFTPAERDCCRARRAAYECYAARFAAKEAVFKALGTGFSGCCWHDVEITNGPGGGPVVALTGSAARVAARRGITGVLLSLSHEGDQAVAFAIAVGPSESQRK